MKDQDIAAVVAPFFAELNQALLNIFLAVAEQPSVDVPKLISVMETQNWGDGVMGAKRKEAYLKVLQDLHDYRERTGANQAPLN